MNQRWTISLLLLGITLPALAQPGPGAGAGMSPVLSVLFKDFQAFSATAEVELSGATKEDAMTMPMRVYYLNEDMRSELDMGQVAGPAVDEALADTLKQIGMNRVVTILQPSAHRTMVLYPNRKAYVVTPSPPASDKTNPPVSISQKTELGQEIVLGMTCTKSQVTFAEGLGQDLTVYIWESPRLRHFPVQIEMKQPLGTMTVRYRDVSFTAPGQDKFNVPADFKKHDGVQSILQEATQELVDPPATPKP